MQRKFQINLGPGEGERNVWCGFRSAAGQIRWQRHRITVDTTPPEIVISKPAKHAVAEPVIQVIGYSPEPLNLLSAEVLRPGGVSSSVSIGITERVFDRAWRQHTETQFQCYDLPLTDGTNILVIRATDLAGNSTVTNFAFLLDASGDSTPTPGTSVRRR